MEKENKLMNFLPIININTLKYIYYNAENMDLLIKICLANPNLKVCFFITKMYFNPSENSGILIFAQKNSFHLTF